MSLVYDRFRYLSDAEWYDWLPEFLTSSGPTWWQERPLRVVWEITNLCNLHCRQCVTLAVDHAEDHPKVPPNELSTDEGQDLIDLWADMGVPILCFSGGEPLLREDFFDLASHAGGRFRAFSVETNGTLVNDAVAQQMAQVGIDELVVGLSGARPETHDAIRGKTSYHRAVSGIKAAQKADLRVTVVTTPMNLNAKEIPEILPALFQAGVSPDNIRHTLTTYVPVGRAITESLEPSPTEQVMVFEGWCDVGGVVWAGTALPLWVPRDEVEADCAAALRGCTAGKHAVVSCEGDVYPCAYLGRTTVDYYLGSVREEDFVQLWRGNETLRAVQDFRLDLEEECGSCPAQQVCGGCRARAVLGTKLFTVADPWVKQGICRVLQAESGQSWARC